jgi:hypothetical protein
MMNFENLEFSTCLQNVGQSRFSAKLAGPAHLHFQDGRPDYWDKVLTNWTRRISRKWGWIIEKYLLLLFWKIFSTSNVRMPKPSFIDLSEVRFCHCERFGKFRRNRLATSKVLCSRRPYGISMIHNRLYCCFLINSIELAKNERK